MALFIQHVNTVLGKLRETPITVLSTDPATEAWRAQEAVRRAVARVWNAKQWSFKIRSYSFPTVANTEAYALRQVVGEPFSILSSQSPYKLPVISEAALDNYVPNRTEITAPRSCRLFEMQGATAQPTSAAVVSVVSSSASDVTQKVLVKGYVNGSIDYEELSLAGTAPVQSTKSFSAIEAITKSDVTAGAVTVSSGATTLATMAPQDTTVRARIMRLYPTPDAVYTITVKYFGTPPVLTHAYEDTEVPVRWDYVVDQFAFALALQSKGKEQSEEFNIAYNVAVKMLEQDMTTEEYASSEEIIVPQRWGSNLGGLDPWASLPSGYSYPSPY